MSKKFENIKLNKQDHAKVDRDASMARGTLGALGLCSITIAIKKVPWKKVGGAISKLAK